MTRIKLEIIQQFIDEFIALSAEFHDEDSAFFVAYSGGLDSVVLLDLMTALAEHKANMRVFTLHFDHGLHADSAKWADFCAAVSAEYGVKHFSCDQGVNLDKSIGLEASASRSRYNWFSEIIESTCRERGISNGILLTAHHGDDQAETLLMNMLRGSGLKGMRGIAEKKVLIDQNDHKQALLRPLLSFSKHELLVYAKAKKLDWIEDPSNQDSRFRRNDLRHNVLPELKRIRPDAVQQMTKLSRRMVEAESLLTELAINDLAFTEQFAFCPLDGSFGLGLAGLRNFGISRQLNAIRCWLTLVGYPVESEMDLLQVLDWSINGTNSGAELRRGHRYYRYYQDTLYVMPIEYTITSLVHEELLWKDLRQPLGVLKHSKGAVYSLNCAQDSQYLEKSLIIKTPENVGEILLPKGEGHIQAKKCFQSAKVPPWRRKKALFAVSEDNRFIELVGGQQQRDLSIQALND